MMLFSPAAPLGDSNITQDKECNEGSNCNNTESEVSIISDLEIAMGKDFSTWTTSVNLDWVPDS